MGVRDPWRYPKISVLTKEGRSVSRRVMLPEMKTHGHGYHADLELSDRSQERLEMKTHGQVIT